MITFIASAPATTTYMRVHGDGGLRLTLDISETEADGIIDDLSRLRGKTLSVAIVATELDQDCTKVNDGTPEESTERSTVVLGRRRA